MSRRKYIYDLSIGKHVLVNYPPPHTKNPQKPKRQIKFFPLKLKSSIQQKTLKNKVKRQVTNWKRFTTHTPLTKDQYQGHTEGSHKYIRANLTQKDITFGKMLKLAGGQGNAKQN